MVLKRKRNLKIDTTASYSVFLLRDLNRNEVEDYLENRDTGMEAEEEKELHLQNIMKGTGKDIPIPVVAEIENISRSRYEKKELKKRIIWEKDCPNDYIEDRSDVETEKEMQLKLHELISKSNPQGISTEKGSFIPIETFNISNKSTGTLNSGSHPDSIIKVVEHESNSAQQGAIATQRHPIASNIYKIDSKRPAFKDIIKRIGSDKNAYTIKDENIVNFCLRKTLVRYERPGFEAYTCFRDRIFNPTFKSRRNETLMFEKINRMGVEFGTLKKLCEMYKEKCMYEDKAYKQTIKIFKKLSSSSVSKLKKRMLVKMMYKFPEKGPGSKMKINIYDIMTDRQKIVNLKTTKSSNELYLDIKYYNEVMSLIKFDEKENQANKDKTPKKI
ncbi:uncharacterized protein VICG_01465 [Vittaforma corneae ATCC 50505]|uniref:Uncharacterized protein n=1 Tax=Vittaforma corneae (strain ATCC 50505) TaxID=993615 RepID=L2GKU8_VITCO|nr:uncharacterized protein VICG_01465 [Vittaforma corneae ATCC 50505]ELA41481.1 hypothetical protein VICG_01465 [Vittaforma corneae ATCC 50505]